MKKGYNYHESQFCSRGFFFFSEFPVYLVFLRYHVSLSCFRHDGHYFTLLKSLRVLSIHKSVAHNNIIRTSLTLLASTGWPFRILEVGLHTKEEDALHCMLSVST